MSSNDNYNNRWKNSKVYHNIFECADYTRLSGNENITQLELFVVACAKYKERRDFWAKYCEVPVEISDKSDELALREDRQNPYNKDSMTVCANKKARYLTNYGYIMNESGLFVKQLVRSCKSYRIDVPEPIHPRQNQIKVVLSFKNLSEQYTPEVVQNKLSQQMFVHKLVALIRKNDTSTEKLADKIGVCTDDLIAVMLGHKTADLPLIEKLANAFDVKPVDLINPKF